MGESGWLAGWLGGWLPGWLAGWVGGWLAGWEGGWVAGWLGGWVVVWVGGCARACATLRWTGSFFLCFERRRFHESCATFLLEEVR